MGTDLKKLADKTLGIAGDGASQLMALLRHFGMVQNYPFLRSRKCLPQPLGEFGGGREVFASSITANMTCGPPSPPPNWRWTWRFGGGVSSVFCNSCLNHAAAFVGEGAEGQMARRRRADSGTNPKANRWTFFTFASASGLCGSRCQSYYLMKP